MPWHVSNGIQSVIPTSYWHPLDDGRIQCDVCPRACKLREGQRGLCFVRARQDDEVVLTTMGAAAALRRSHREEAAEPLPPRLGSALLQHGWLQPRLPGSGREDRRRHCRIHL
jgi:hypothetical protein